MAGLRVVIKEKGWDETPFLYAYEKVIEQHYTFKKTYKKPKSSPNRKLKAKIEIEIGLYDCTALLIVEDKNQKKICTKLLYKEKPRWEILNGAVTKK